MLKNEQEKVTGNKLLQMFWNLQKKFMDAMQTAAAHHGLSISQYIILMTIHQQKSMTQKAIQEDTNLPKSTLSYAVNHLVELGMLERSQVKENRREVLLALNKKGKKLIQQINGDESSFPRIFYRSIDSLTNEQQQELLDVFKQMIVHFEKEGSENVD